MQSKSETDLWGIDVSHHQGNIDWQQVAGAGVQFAYVKSSEGIGMIDDQLGNNAAGANEVGIPVGFYHFAHPEVNSPGAEAVAYAEAVSGLTAQLPHCLDLEGSKAAALSTADLTDWALTWCREVHRLTGHPVILYTGAYFARDELGAAMGEFPLWIAHYGATTPLDNGTWQEWGAFQYSEGGTVPGIAGHVDMDYMSTEFFNRIMAPLVSAEEAEVDDMARISTEDGQKLINILKEVYRLDVREANGEPVSREETVRLGKVVRDAAGLPADQ